MFVVVPIEVKNVRKPQVPPLANGVLVAVTVLAFAFGQSTSWHMGPGQSLWTVIGYGFAHGSPWHLLANMFVLLIIGNPVNRRLGNVYYLAVYFGTLLVLGIIGRLMGLDGLVGASGAIFAVAAVFLMLMPKARVDVIFAAVFPVSLLVGVLRRPKEWIHWFISWGRFESSAWWCFLIIPLMEIWGLFWWRSTMGIWQWHQPAHLLGFLIGVVATLLLPTAITMPGRELKV